VFKVKEAQILLILMSSQKIMMAECHQFTNLSLYISWIDARQRGHLVQNNTHSVQTAACSHGTKVQLTSLVKHTLQTYRSISNDGVSSTCAGNSCLFSRQESIKYFPYLM
jgi:hypothetical protein